LGRGSAVQVKRGSHRSAAQQIRHCHYLTHFREGYGPAYPKPPNRITGSENERARSAPRVIESGHSFAVFEEKRAALKRDAVPRLRRLPLKYAPFGEQTSWQKKTEKDD
jgi:hypothetical protein